MLLLCPKCAAKVATPTGYSFPTATCGICGTEFPHDDSHAAPDDTKSKASPFPKSIQASIVATDWTSISDSLRETWPSICDAARAYLAYFPRRAAVADRLRIYIRPDGGSLFFAVCPKPPRGHDGGAGFILVPHLESEYFNLAESEDGLEQGHEALMLQVTSAIKIACSPDLSPLPITVVDYSDLETERFLADVDARELA